MIKREQNSINCGGENDETIFSISTHIVTQAQFTHHMRHPPAEPKPTSILVGSTKCTIRPGCQKAVAQYHTHTDKTLQNEERISYPLHVAMRVKREKKIAGWLAHVRTRTAIAGDKECL